MKIQERKRLSILLQNIKKHKNIKAFDKEYTIKSIATCKEYTIQTIATTIYDFILEEYQQSNITICILQEQLLFSQIKAKIFKIG